MNLNNDTTLKSFQRSKVGGTSFAGTCRQKRSVFFFVFFFVIAALISLVLFCYCSIGQMILTNGIYSATVNNLSFYSALVQDETLTINDSGKNTKYEIKSLHSDWNSQTFALLPMRAESLFPDYRDNYKTRFGDVASLHLTIPKMTNTAPLGEYQILLETVRPNNKHYLYRIELVIAEDGTGSFATVLASSYSPSDEGEYIETTEFNWTKERNGTYIFKANDGTVVSLKLPH